MTMKVTIREVAESAKVSLGTASRVLNGDPTVNPEHFKRVSEAAKRLNYQRLRSRRRQCGRERLEGRSIGLVMLGMDRSLVSLPVIAEAVHAAEAALSKRSATTVFIDVPDLNQPPPSLSLTQLDGVLLKGALQGDGIARCTHPAVRRLFTIPHIWLLGRPDGCEGDGVGSNDFRIGQMAADYLLAKSHKCVAVVNPKSDHVTFANRQVAFEARIRRAGGQVVQVGGGAPQQWSLPLKPATDIQTVLESVDQALAADPRPTALFCPADSIAAAVYRALAIRGKTVGEDMSVISVNNEQSLINILHPQLTTIDINAAQMGARAVERLAWRMNNALSPEMIEIVLDPTLVEGASVVDLNSAPHTSPVQRKRGDS